jgi:hypothetical protein
MDKYSWGVHNLKGRIYMKKVKTFCRKDQKLWILIAVSFLFTAIGVGVALLLSKMSADECDCCDDDGEYCDEHGCCYTDEKDFI